MISLLISLRVIVQHFIRNFHHKNILAKLGENLYCEEQEMRLVSHSGASINGRMKG